MLGSRRESGFSLLEMMIVLGITTVGAYGFWNTRQMSDAQRLKAEALMNGTKAVQQLNAYLQRDQKFLATAGIVVAHDGTELQLTRIRPNQSDPLATYQVFFTSECSPFPQDRSDYSRIFKSEAMGSIYDASHPCLAKLNCAAGLYPRVRISTIGTGAAEYAASSFPQLTQSIIGGPAGIALCAEQGTGFVKVWTETIQSEKSATLGIKTKVVSQPLLMTERTTGPSELVILP